MREMTSLKNLRQNCLELNELTGFSPRTTTKQSGQEVRTYQDIISFTRANYKTTISVKGTKSLEKS